MDGAGELVWRKGDFTEEELKNFHVVDGGCGNRPRANFFHKPNETSLWYWQKRWGALVKFRLKSSSPTKVQAKWVIEVWVDDDPACVPVDPAFFPFSAWQKTAQTREVPVED